MVGVLSIGASSVLEALEGRHCVEVISKSGSPEDTDRAGKKALALETLDGCDDGDGCDDDARMALD